MWKVKEEEKMSLDKRNSMNQRTRGSNAPPLQGYGGATLRPHALLEATRSLGSTRIHKH
jgi:hypothetical protein